METSPFSRRTRCSRWPPIGNIPLTWKQACSQRENVVLDDQNTCYTTVLVENGVVITLFAHLFAETQRHLVLAGSPPRSHRGEDPLWAPFWSLGGVLSTIRSIVSWRRPSKNAGQRHFRVERTPPPQGGPLHDTIRGSPRTKCLCVSANRWANRVMTTPFSTRSVV